MAITSRFDVISAMAERSGDGVLIRNMAIVKSTVAFKKLLFRRLWAWTFRLMFIMFPNLHCFWISDGVANIRELDSEIKGCGRLFTR